MTSRHLGLCALAALVACSAPSFAQTATTKVEGVTGAPQIDEKTQAEDIRLRDDRDNRMTVPVRLSGAGPYQFLVDTGADRTAVSRELVSKLSLPSAGIAELHSVSGVSQINTARVSDVELTQKPETIDAAVLDRANMGADGIVGADLLRSERVQFDFENHTMTIVPSRTPDFRAEGQTIVVRAWRKNGRLVVTDADIDGARVVVVLDTGSDISMGNEALRRRFAGRDLVDLNQTIDLQSVTGGKIRGDSMFIPKMTIGAITLKNLAVVITEAHTFTQLGLEKKPALLLGMNAMRAFKKVSIDFANKKFRVVVPEHSALDTKVAWGGRPLIGRLHLASEDSLDSEIDVSIGQYDRSIQQAYRALFPGDPDKSPELLKWRFQSNPHGDARFAVARRDSQIVGLIALVPTRLRNAPGTEIGYQAIDTVVHPSCRGQGVFVKMGSLAQEPRALGADVLWGFPNANAAPGWYGRLGWTNFGPVPLLIRPLRSSFLFRRIHPKLRSIDVVLVKRGDSRANLYVDGAELGRDFNELWERSVQDCGISVDRSGEWMRWRLFDKPGANYRCVGIRSDAGTLEAFLATKIADKHGTRLCYVMEAIGTRERTSDLSRLLAAELGRAASSGAEAALAWCPKSAPNYRAYRRAGFVPLPPRLRPIEINFGARALASEAARTAAADTSWYVSFLDSDTN
jgi:predicted aspartyl protease/GNAT superfamily N-acetyltransferase